MSSFLKGEAGASTVEFALLVPVLLALVFAIFGFAIGFGDYLAVTHAAREGARLAAVGRYDEQTVRDRAFPVDPTSIALTYPSGNTHGQPVEVRVRYDFRLSIPFFGERSIPITSQARMRLEV